MTTVVLVGSPLLGPAVWRPTATQLRRRGRAARVAPAPARPPRRPVEVLDHLLGQLPAHEETAVVAHSNAGLYVPALSAARPVVAAVLADAALPPAAGSTPMAPPALRSVLRGLADAEGLLPPWTAWWPEEDVAPLFPDAATRAAVEAEQQRLPLAYLAEQLAVPAGWTGRPAAYLAFSEAYHGQRDRAAGWGWPVRTLPGGHLHPLVDPAGTAAAIDALLDRLGVGGAGDGAR